MKQPLLTKKPQSTPSDTQPISDTKTVSTKQAPTKPILCCPIDHEEAPFGQIFSVSYLLKATATAATRERKIQGRASLSIARTGFKGRTILDIFKHNMRGIHFRIRAARRRCRRFLTVAPIADYMAITEIKTGRASTQSDGIPAGSHWRSICKCTRTQPGSGQRNCKRAVC